MTKHKDIESRFRNRLKETGLSTPTIRLFRKIIYAHYHRNSREMPWRKTRNPYRILLSEIMLQQTQVERVLEKYREFIRAFPDFSSLAKAPLSEVLMVWQGMGYNRRAIALRNTAEIVTKEFKGRLPADAEELLKLPGIGRYSASAVYTFVTGKPSIFIETNIRRVYIHFFFDERVGIKDSEIVPILEKTVDRKNPREWYYALMDYGAKLRNETRNPNRRSAHYQKQSAFHGSARQVRGMVLKTLLHTPGLTRSALKKRLPSVPENFDEILEGLVKEGFLKKSGNKISVS